MNGNGKAMSIPSLMMMMRKVERTMSDNPMAQACYDQAQAEYAAGDLKAALLSVEAAYELDIFFSEAKLLRGHILCDMGETEQGEDDIWWAITDKVELYRPEYQPIMCAEEESEREWAEWERKPETQAYLDELENEAIVEMKRGELKELGELLDETEE